ncbi:hypothetical protein N431DRAFT_443668 [Stipitochalara longipes BDJ]|nr:hypothetical protein N431DRAFT_443668 [Stipitochalara longipes BDJ]
MHFPSLIISLLAASTQAALNGKCSNGGAGICLYTSTCTANGGSYKPNYCPGTPDDAPTAVECCTIDGCYPSGGFIESYCDWTSHGCPDQGSFHAVGKPVTPGGRSLL